MSAVMNSAARLHPLTLAGGEMMTRTLCPRANRADKAGTASYPNRPRGSALQVFFNGQIAIHDR